MIGDPLVYVQITKEGRKLVREATGEQREKPPPPGTLREWHWRAMVEAWKGRPAGVMASGGWYGDYGRTDWKTWLRLREYRDGPLIEEYQTPGQYNTTTGTRYDMYWLRLSALGEQFYRENWQRYRELYPEVDAPEPE